MGTRAKLTFKKGETYKSMWNRLDGNTSASNDSNLGIKVYQLIKVLNPSKADSIFQNIGLTSNSDKAVSVDDGVEFINALLKSNGKEKVYMYKSENINDYLYSYILDFNKNVLTISTLGSRKEIPFSAIQKMSPKEFDATINMNFLVLERDMLLNQFHSTNDVRVKNMLKEDINKIQNKIVPLKNQVQL